MGRRDGPLAAPRTEDHGGWLPVVRPHLDPVLVGSRALDAVERLARRLPAAGSTVLEVRLARGMPTVDLSVELRGPEQARAVLRAGGLALRPEQRELLRRWAGEDRSLAPVEAMWLELDLDPGRESEPEPVVCLRLQPGVRLEAVERDLVPALHGRRLGEVQRDLVRRCWKELPAGARLLYLLSLRPRGQDAVRLELFGLASEALYGYLERAAPAASAQVKRVLPLFAGCERIHLSLDIARREILPRVGIEYAFRRQPPREGRWEELLDRLVEAGFCTPAKRAAIDRWPGHDSFWSAPARWPVGAVGPRGSCVRCLSHLKLLTYPERPPEAKVYLLYGFVAAAV